MYWYPRELGVQALLLPPEGQVIMELIASMLLGNSPTLKNPAITSVIQYR